MPQGLRGHRVAIFPTGCTSSSGETGIWRRRTSWRSSWARRPPNVAAMAESMGLPPAAAVPAEQKSRGYITLIRRNWHLLPYDQLLELVEMTPEQLAFALREDDFLWVKLGMSEAQVRAFALRRPGRGGPRSARPRSSGWSRRSSATRLQRPGEPRFHFLQRVQRAGLRDPPRPPCLRPATTHGCRCDSSIPIRRSTATRC